MADFRDRFQEYAQRAFERGERFVITRHGKPIAALVALEDLARLEPATPPPTGPENPGSGGG